MGGWGGGGGLRGRGQGTFHPPCHTLHYYMVLRPKGTSHNKSITRTRVARGDVRPPQDVGAATPGLASLSL